MTHTYAIELPTDTKHAHNIDTKNKNIFWKDGIDLEIRNNEVAFEIREEKKQAHQG